MPTPKAQVARPLIPAGEHILTLHSVDEREMDNTFKPGERTTRWLWDFSAEQKDENGVPYEFGLFTNDTYGAPRASLTHLFDSIFPGITVEQATKVNTDILINRKFSVLIKHESEKGAEPKARLVRISVIKKGEEPVTAAPAEEAYDPFADD